MSQTFGPTFSPVFDGKRLNEQMSRIFNLMSDGCWRTFSEIHASTGDPEASISANLRHFRKEKFGAHTVYKKRRGDTGLYEYQLIVNRSIPKPVAQATELFGFKVDPIGRKVAM